MSPTGDIQLSDAEIYWVSVRMDEKGRSFQRSQSWANLIQALLKYSCIHAQMVVVRLRDRSA